MKVTDDIKLDAIRAIHGMRLILKRDMLDHESGYFSDEVRNPELAEQGAICGGHTMCAVGSLFFGAGVRPKVNTYPNGEGGTYSIFDNKGFLPGTRAHILNDRPGLELAYKTLNKLSEKYVEEHTDGLMMTDDEGDEYEGGLEILFECYDVDAETLLKLTKKAVKKIEAM